MTRSTLVAVWCSCVESSLPGSIPAFMLDSYVTATMTPHDRASAPCVAISSSSCLSSQHLLCPSVPPQSCLEIPPARKMPGPCHLPPAGTLECLSLVASWIVGWWIRWGGDLPPQLWLHSKPPTAWGPKSVPWYRLNPSPSHTRTYRVGHRANHTSWFDTSTTCVPGIILRSLG